MGLFDQTDMPFLRDLMGGGGGWNPANGPPPVDENDMQRQAALSKPPVMPPVQGLDLPHSPEPMLEPGAKPNPYARIGANAGINPDIFGGPSGPEATTVPQPGSPNYSRIGREGGPVQGPMFDVPQPSPGGMPGTQAGPAGAPPSAAPQIPMPPPRPNIELPPGATPTGPAPPAPPSIVAGPPWTQGNAMDQFARRAFGDMQGSLSPADRARGKFMSSLGAGLTAAGKSAGLSPAQAAFGGAGAAIEGGEKRSDVQEAQGEKRLDTALKAMQMGNLAEYRKQVMAYNNEKLKATGMNARQKASLWENPSWRYLNMQRQITSEIDVERKKLAEKKNRTPEEVDADNRTLDAKKKELEAKYTGAFNITPQELQKQQQFPMGKHPDNPWLPQTEGDFTGMKIQKDDLFRNPADTKIYKYKGPNVAPEKQPGQEQRADTEQEHRDSDQMNSLAQDAA